jgi:hypothetical protein
VQEGKCKLEDRQFDKARELIAEANRYLHSSKLSLALLGLGIAPGATTKLIAFWNWIRSGTKA